MRRHRIWYGAVLAAALLIYIIANSRISLIVLGSLVLIPLCSAGMQFAVMRHLQIECEMKNSCRVGKNMPLRLTLHKGRGIPMGVVEVDMDTENMLYQEKESKQLLLQPSDKREMEYQYLFPMEDCGHVRIRIPYVKCYDLLGLFCWNIPLNKMIEVLVHPAQMRFQAELSRRPETKMSGEWHDPARKGQDVSEMVGLRNYVPGDSLGWIHWKLSGKSEELVVREFGYPSDYNLLILYDMRKQVNDSVIANVRNNAVLAVTTALSYNLLEMGLEHQVGKIEAGEYQSSPVYSIATHEQMVMNLLCRPVAEKETSAETLYHFLRSNLKNEVTKVVYVTTEYDEESVKTLARQVDLTVIHVEQGAGEELVNTAGYTVISIDADNYRNKLYHVVL